MSFDRFIIGPLGGLENDLKPFMVPDDAMVSMDNVYVFRGRIRKRFGTRNTGDSVLNSRLSVIVDTSDGGGSSSGIVPGGVGAIGQAFSIGNEFFTVFQPTGFMKTTGGASTYTFDIASGVFIFTGVAALTSVIWYPSLPVMGLSTYEQPSSGTNQEISVAFDTKFAYSFNGRWNRLANPNSAGDSIWTGNDTQFFWTTNWSGASAADRILFVTNGNPSEPNYMRYFFNNTWFTFNPAITSSVNLVSARILVVFQNRLIAFNTFEGTSNSSFINYQNRARWSQIGDPTSNQAWRQDIPGLGSARDCPVNEQIITVEFVKDRLIVFFERSTWEFVYTQNQSYPFVWQEINTELGAESTFSVVPFDKIALAVGNSGILACNGANVERIDDKIPNEVFDIHNLGTSTNRVSGIRDYLVEMVYWTFPTAGRLPSFQYPNRVLVFNYKTGTWAFNDDSFTTFGYFFQSQGVTWDSTEVTWDSDIVWGSGSSQSVQRRVIAGNQEGFILLVDPDQPTNAPGLQITDIKLVGGTIQITCVNHNFDVGEVDVDTDFVQLNNLNGLTPVAPYTSFPSIFQVNMVQDSNTFSIISPEIYASLTDGQTYIGGGTISRVSQINMMTKQFNFYPQAGRNAYIQKVDFLVDTTANGQLTVDFFNSTNPNSLVKSGQATGAIIGTNILDTFPYSDIYPYEAEALQVWHPVYFQGDAAQVQLQLYMTPDQMLNPLIANSQFQLHQMVFYATPTSSRLQ